jgi:hypothetical protein
MNREFSPQECWGMIKRSLTARSEIPALSAIAVSAAAVIRSELRGEQ